MKSASLTILTLSLLSAVSNAEPPPIRVLVWDERQPEQNQAYENFLGNAIAEHLMEQPGFQVKSAGLDSPDQGLDAATLDATDVIIWWGHRRHPDVNHGSAVALVDRIKAGKLSLIALHSAHWSQPFVEAMAERAREDALKQIPETERASAKLDLVRPKPFAAPKRTDPLTPALTRAEEPNTWRLILPICCFPAWRADGAPSHLKTLLPDHPITKGIPAEFDIPQTEMYDEPFHIPQPDAVVFEERWDKGEHFRSGCVWQVGKGHVFYFRPGHETYPIYTQPTPLKIIENATRWLSEETNRTK